MDSISLQNLFSSNKSSLRCRLIGSTVSGEMGDGRKERFQAKRNLMMGELKVIK